MFTVKESCDFHLQEKDIWPQQVNGNLVTKCNIFVQRVCEDYGYHKLKGKLANAIFDFCSESSDFFPVGMEDAEEYASKDLICIAALKMSVHGHVGIVYPGIKLFSGKWNMEVPRVAHVGGFDKNGIPIMGVMGVNYAFRDKPSFFLLKENS